MSWRVRGLAFLDPGPAVHVGAAAPSPALLLAQGALGPLQPEEPAQDPGAARGQAGRKSVSPRLSPCLEGGLVLLLDGGEEEAGEEGGVELVGVGFLEEADELLGMLGSELDLLLAQGGELAPDVTDGRHGWCAPVVSSSLG